MSLSDDQIEQFKAQGFLVVEDALQDSDLQPVIDDYEALVDRLASRWLEEGRISQLHADESFERRFAALCADNEELYSEEAGTFDIMNARGRGSFHFLHNERLVALMEGILGSEITCSPIQHVRAKLPTAEGAANPHVAPWHQDAQVHTDDADAVFILTVWLPLCDATPENGCLQVIPGISTGKTVFWKAEGFGIDDENLPGEPIDVPMKKGSVLFMHKLTPHGSGPNRTNNIRWSLDLRYQRTGTPTGRAVYPDFPVLSRSNPHSVLTDYEDWDRLWAEAKKNNPKKAGRANRPVGPTTVNVEDPFAAIAV